MSELTPVDNMVVNKEPSQAPITDETSKTEEAVSDPANTDNFDLSLLQENNDPEEERWSPLMSLELQNAANPYRKSRVTTDITDAQTAAKGAILGSSGTAINIEAYKKIFADFDSGADYSQSLANIVKGRKEAEMFMAKKQLATMVLEEKLTSKDAVLNTLEKTTDRVVNRTLDQSVARKAAEDYSPRTSEEEAFHDDKLSSINFASNIDNAILGKYRLQDALNHSYADTNAVNTTTGFAGVVVPGRSQLGVKGLADFAQRQGLGDITAGFGATTDFVNPAYVKEQYKKKIEELWITDPARAEQVQTDLIKELDGVNGVAFFGGNEFMNSVTKKELIEGGAGSYNERTPEGQKILNILKKSPLFIPAHIIDAVGFDKVVDNVTSWMDLYAIGGSIRGFVKAVKSMTPAGKALLKQQAEAKLFNAALAKAQARTVIDSTTADSPAAIAAITNPDLAKTLQRAAVLDPEASKATLGTTNAGDVATHTLGPKLGSEENIIDDAVGLAHDDPVLAAAKGGGAHISEAEAASVKAKILEDVSHVEGARVNMALTTVVDDTAALELKTVEGPVAGVQVDRVADSMKVKFVIGPAEGAYKSARQAVDTALFSLRKFGATVNDITVMQKVGSKWFPIAKDKLDTALNIERLSKEAASLLDKKIDDLEKAVAKETKVNKAKETKALNKHLEDNKGKIAGGVDAMRGLFSKGPQESILKTGVDGKRGLFSEGPKVQPVEDLSATRMINSSDKIPDDLSVTAKRPPEPTPIGKYDLVGPIKPVETALQRELRNAKEARKALLRNNPPSEFMVQVERTVKTTIDAAPTVSPYQVAISAINRFFIKSNLPYLSDLGMGSLQSYIFPASSVFKDMFFHLAHSNAVDRASNVRKVLMEDVKVFSEAFESLSVGEKSVLSKYIEDANRQGIKLDTYKLRVDGWTNAMLESVTKWRRVWDRVYLLENSDRLKGYIKDGYHRLVIGGVDKDSLVKPLTKGGAESSIGGKGALVYDAEKQATRSLDFGEIEKIYAEGGSISKFENPKLFDGEGVEFVVTKNVDHESGYTRALTEGDRVLPYREGYYHVKYEHPYYIESIIKDSRGKVLYTEAIGAADSLKEAELLKSHMLGKDANLELNIRGDKKANKDLFDKFAGDLQWQPRRSSQQLRGEQLESLVNQNTLGLSDIANPMDALVGAVRSISERVSMRDWFDTNKTRLMRNYRHLMPTNPATGQKMYPRSAREIQDYSGGLSSGKEVGDARTVYQYIRSTEDGYVNQIDDIWKLTATNLADFFSNKSSTIEKGFRAIANAKGPVDASRAAVATMFLFSAPARQLVVQGSQTMQLLAVARPSWVLKSPAQMMAVMARTCGMPVNDTMLKMAGWGRADFEVAFDAFQRSGQGSAIDHNNLIRGVLTDLADRSAMSKARRAVTLPLHVARRVGFDLGEYTNQLATWLASADRAIAAGKNIADPLVQEEVSAWARNFSGSMNSSGDMPYNHGTLAVPMQFAQVGHKMFMNMTFNQHLTAAEKGKLWVMNLAVFGIPAEILYNESFTKHLPEDPEWRRNFTEGLLGWQANKMIEMAGGSDRYDISGTFSPVNAGLTNIVNTIFTANSGSRMGNFAEMISKSPAGSLFFGANPRVTTFMKEVSQWIVPSEDMAPADVGSVYSTFIRMFSGWTNHEKAMAILEHSRTVSASGRATARHAEAVAVVMAELGIRTQAEVNSQVLNNNLYNNAKNKESMAKDLAKNLALQFGARGMSFSDDEVAKQSLQIGYAMLKDDPKALDIFNQEIAKRIRANEFDSAGRLWDSINDKNLSHSIQMLDLLPTGVMDEKTKDDMREGLKSELIYNRDGEL